MTAKKKRSRVIQRPWKVTFALYMGGHCVQRSSIVNTKANVLAMAKNLRRLGYKVKTRALKRPYRVR